MNVREIVELVVRYIVELTIRLLGVAFLYNALAAVPVAIGNFCPIFPHMNFRSLFPSAILIGWPLVVGWYLVRGAPWLMQHAFKNTRNTPPLAQATPQTNLFSGPGRQGPGQ